MHCHRNPHFMNQKYRLVTTFKVAILVSALVAVMYFLSEATFLNGGDFWYRTGNELSGPMTINYYLIVIFVIIVWLVVLPFAFATIFVILLVWQKIKRAHKN